MTDELRTMISSMTQEYADAGGFLTCEFATSREEWEEKIKVLSEESRALASLQARWVAYECETCAGYHGADCNIHVAIENLHFCPHNEDGLILDTWMSRSGLSPDSEGGDVPHEEAG